MTEKDTYINTCVCLSPNSPLSNHMTLVIRLLAQHQSKRIENSGRDVSAAFKSDFRSLDLAENSGETVGI